MGGSTLCIGRPSASAENIQICFELDNRKWNGKRKKWNGKSKTSCILYTM